MCPDPMFQTSQGVSVLRTVKLIRPLKDEITCHIEMKAPETGSSVRSTEYNVRRWPIGYASLN